MRSVLLLVGVAVLAGIGNTATIYVPDEYPAIQDAISAAADGDTVIVRPGTYVENIDFLGKAITLQSELGPDVTIIDGNRAGSVVTFQSGEDLASILDGFTILNGKGTDKIPSGWFGGGGICLLNSSATIRGCIIRDNNARNGGGIGARNSDSEIMNCQFLNNNSLSGAGIGLYEYSAGQITSSTFQGNECSSGGDGGGGLYCEYSSPVIDACVFSENYAPVGGAISLESYSDPTISSCSIVGNSASSYGGIRCWESSPTITNCRITDNVADRAGGIGMDEDSWPVIIGNTISFNSSQSYDGGGISCRSAPQEITNNLIEGNTAGGDGGGVYLNCWLGGSPVTISGNTIRGNSAFSYYGGGGGIYCSGFSSDTALIEENTIEGNSAAHGGGIYFYSGGSRLLRNFIFRNRADLSGGGVYSVISDLEVINCMIAQNEAYLGGGLFFCADSCFTNCTIADNKADEGAGLYYNDYHGTITFVNSILWDRPTVPDSEIFVGYYYNEPILTYSNIRGGWPGTGNIAKPPLFAAPGELDYHLTYDSPCRDAGDNAAPGMPAKDFEWDPRIADTAVDMGFDEFHRHLYHTGTVTPGAWIKVNVVGTPCLSPVELGLGSGVADPPLTTIYGHLWLQSPIEAIFWMPDINNEGYASRLFKVPTGWIPGEEYPFQALLGPRVPGSRLTNLHVLEVE